jgi:amidase/6-aminohexanoate-cyclic-dimer hydrolase
LIDDYESHDATSLAALVAKREVTAEELLDCALARIEALNPKLNAVVHLVPDTARRAIAAGLPQGPFRGVPFLMKDLGAEAVDFPAHNGSRLLANTRYAGDSEIYLRIKRAGLVTFGRTTAPEGGIGPVTDAVVYGGPTRNPWSLDRTPGGSSGGSGAAVAAGIVPAAHGSDGGGSVRIPASSCGLFGVKPTRARLPDGPFAGEGWAGMAMDGFLTRSVRDNAALLDACAGPDLGAPYVAPPMPGTYRDAMAKPTGPLRVAAMFGAPDGGAIDPECRAAVESTAQVLESMGHHVVETRPNADVNGMMRAWTHIVACGADSWVRSAARKRGVGKFDLIETVARGACRLAEQLSGADYLDAVNKVHAFGREMAAFFLDHDILLSATLAEPPAKIGRFAHDRPEFADFEAYRTGPEGVFAYSPFTAIFNASGQPAASLPLHWTANGLPVGVHLGAAFGADEMLMSLCARLEEAAPWFDKRPPM